ncbi:MAG: 50S ribosomal protein L24 [Candidatus Melainabacteria bacterium GWA2_34_9]|nr:MAG: 50S ribosomal protein L24 [Candidatus Melainabacteria bacterium GWA2_34_9]
MKNVKKVKGNQLHIKTGDRVMVIAGKDKGKVSNVKKALPQLNKVIVEDANMITKAMKANPMANFAGGLIKMEAPLNVSKVMLYCQKCEKPTRISYKVLENGKKTRVCKKCSEQFDV